MLSAGFALHVGFSQLGGYDLSPLIDAGWRFEQGQRPGPDYISTLPNLYLVWIKLSRLFPSGWGALIWVNIVATASTLAVLMIVQPAASRDLHWTVCTSIICCLPLIYTNHLWHSTLSQLAAIAHVAALCRAITDGSPSLRSHGVVGLTAGLVAIAKQNMAVPLLAVTVVFLWFVRTHHRRWLIGSVVGGMAAAPIVSAAWLGQSPRDLFYAYWAVRGRSRLDPAMLWQSAQLPTNYPVLALGVIAAWAAGMFLYRSRRRLPPGVWLQASCFMAALVPLLTDWDAKLNNAPFPLFLIGMLVTQERILLQRNGAAGAPWHLAPLRRSFTGVLLGLGLAAVHGGWVRERMRAVGPFFESTSGHIVAHGYFKDLRVGPHFERLLAELDAVGRAYPHSATFFGPRLEFGYQVLRRQSPRGLPLWWHPGSSFALADSAAVLEAFRRSTFALLVFVRDDRTRMPSSLLRHIDSAYVPVAGFQYLDVYRSRSSVEPAGSSAPDGSAGSRAMGRHQRATVSCRGSTQGAGGSPLPGSPRSA
jgi:hypothetical protein